MADGTIFDQTQETELTAAHRLLVQDTSAATASQSATFALMGGLEVSNETVTTADITGAVGKLYVCTIAGLTASRNLTLPSAQIGERVGVYIVDGDATYELILKGAASQTINGGTAATEWSRLFIANEMVIFRCTAANTWIVEQDGRIPSHARIDGDGGTDQTINDATWTDVTLFNRDLYDVGDIADNANNRINFRRDGSYFIGGAGNSGSTETGDFRMELSNSSGLGFHVSNKEYINTGQNGATIMAIADVSVSTDAYVKMEIRADIATADFELLASFVTYIEVLEILVP